MKSKRFRTRSGFTLVDLVVVVALVAFLTPILLASVRVAGEDARIAKCLSNLRGLMRATSMYFNDYHDEFPFQVRSTGGWLGVSSWTYGGKTNDAYWKTQWSGVLYVPVTERPLNDYLLGAQVEPDLAEDHTIIERTEIPMLKCPSDRSSFRRAYGGGGDQGAISCYDDVGTSYLYNLDAITDTNVNEWENGGQGWLRLNRVLVRDFMAGRTQDLVYFIEDAMEWALHDLTQKIGNHRELSKHSVGYADGHVDYRYMDTHRWCGPGWAAINTNWVRQFGESAPLIYYTPVQKRCNP